MKNILFWILTSAFMLSFYTGISQPEVKPPDYGKIQNDILNKNSSFYYPLLFERYIKNDTTLNDEDYWYLYYGYTFHKDYIPLGFSHFMDTVLTYLSKKNLSNKELDIIIKFTGMILKDYPFSVRALNYQGYAYHKKGNKQMADFIAYKTNKLLVTMLRSGDGKKKESAFHVINIDNEFDILRALEVQSGGTHELQDNIYDYYTLAPNKYNVPEIYFNVGRILFVSELNKQHQEKEKENQSGEKKK